MAYTEKQKAKMKIYSGNKAYYYEYDCNGEIRNLKLTPPMKGGHTHNHLYNVANRKVFSSKNRRKVPNNIKKQFVQTFYENLNLNYNRSFCEFIRGLK